jgi:tetratricopeptide (TPR) repeat protein
MMRVLLLLSLSACAIVPAAGRARGRAVEARALRDEHRFAEAFARFKEALSLDPADTESARGWIEVAGRLGRTTEVEAFFARRVLVAQNDAAAFAGLGLSVAAQADSRLGEAVSALQRAVLLAPTNGDMAGRLGLVASRAGEWETARAALAKAVALDARRPRWRVAHARALVETGRRSEAVLELKRVTDGAPTRDDIKQALAVSRLLDRTYRNLPARSEERLRGALDLIRMDEVRRAREELAELEYLHPERAVILAAQGLCARQANDGASAVTALRRAMELAPEAAEPALLLADLYAARDKRNEARTLYVRALEADPLLPQAHKQLAEFEIAAGNRPGALEHGRIYALLAPGDLPARLNHVALLEQAEGEDATTFWDGLAFDFPRSPEVLIGRARWNYGRALAATGTERDAAVRRARTDIELLLTVDPENQTAPLLLAELNRL